MELSIGALHSALVSLKFAGEGDPNAPITDKNILRQLIVEG